MNPRRLAFLVVVAACSKPQPGPTLDGIAPDRGPQDRDVVVTITGTRFKPLLVTDFSKRSSSTLDATFTARLGREPLRDVALNEDGSVAATVPQGITPGTYDLVLVTPDGLTLTLPGAYRVLAANELGDLVQSFRFAPIAPQQVGVPFSVTVTAVDQVGLPVDTFAGNAALSDLTGTVVPKQVGPFARGVWTGLVEVRSLHAGDQLTATSTTAKTGTSNAFPVTAGAGARLVFATPARSAVAGACSDSVTVQSVDATSTPSPAMSPIALALVPSPSNGFSLFADAACSVPLATPAIAAGQTGLTFHFRGTRAGAVQLAATAAGLSGAAQTETVTAGAPASLVFLTPDPTLNSGTCSNDVTLQTRDAFDNPAPVAAATMVALDVMPPAALELFATGGCATPLTSLPLASGASTGSFQLRGSMAGAYTVTASAPGLGTAMLRVRVNPAGFPTQLVIVSMPQTVMVGDCSGPLAVQSQDAAGNAVTTPGQLPVTLSASPAMGFTLYSDNGCATPTTMATLGVNTSTTIVYFRGTAAGAVTVTAASPGLQSGVQTENLTPGPAMALTFASAPQTVAAGACSGALDVGLLDSLGNPALAAAAMSVAYTATPAAGVTFYSDAACTMAASTFNLAAGAAQARLYFRGTVAAAETVDATSPGFMPAQQVETVRPAPPAAIVFTSPPQTVGIGACSSPANVEVRDAFGNVSPVGAVTPMTLAANPGAGFTFYSDPSCMTVAASVPIAAMASTASFFFRASSMGPVMVTASPAGLTPAAQTETIVAGAPAKLVFTTPARTAQAATCSAAVTVTVQDASNNASPVPSPLMVTLAVGALQVFSDAGCTMAAATLTVPTGQSSATYYFRSNVAAPYPMTASASGLTDGLQTATVTPAPADRLAFVTPPRTSSAGACSAVVTVARRDAFGNDSPGAAATVALSALPAAGFTFYLDAACTMAAASVPLANGAAQASFYFIGTAAAAETLTATSAPLMPASQAATVTAAAAPSQLVFTTPARTVTAGACSAVLSVQSRDSFNNPRSVAANTAVVLAGAGATFYSDAGCTMAVAQVTIGAGTDTASFYFRGSTAGPLNVTATAAGLNPASQIQTVNAAAPDRLVFTTAPQTLTAGACSALTTVQSRDAFGNVSAPAGAQTVTLTSGAGVTFYANATCTTAVGSVTLNGGATTTSFYFRGTQSGVRTLTAQVTGWTAGTQNATFNAGAATQLVFTTPARTVAAGACSAVLTVEARDALGNTATVGVATNVTLSALPAAGFTFHSNAACSLPAGTPQIPAGGSTVSFYVRGTAAATVGVTATAGGLAPANQSVTVTAAAPAAIVFTTPARSAVAGACSAVLTVELRDAFGNPAPAAAATPLTLAAVPAAGFAFHSNAACSMASGTATVAMGATTASFYFRGTSVGSIAVTVSGAGLTSANQNQTVTAGPVASFQWDPIASPRSYNTPFGVTVRARDAFGNVATGFTGTAVLGITPAGTVNCTSSCTNATTTDVFVAGVWTGTVTLTTIAVVGNNRALTATQGAINGTSNTFNVTGPAARSPPIARFTWNPAVINIGQTVNFDGSPSSDYQTPTAQLQVSFDAELDGNFTAYTTTKTFSHQYNTAGLYRVRMLVRDTDGDIDYRSGWVRVLNPGDRRCRVTTANDVDDGASNCTGNNGADGQLSLAEAVRLSNSQFGTDRITFSAPMTITSTGAYTLNEDTEIYAQPGVILVNKTISMPTNNADVSIWGLEMTGQTVPFSTTGNGADLTLTDVYLHDMAGITSTRGAMLLDQVRMSNCTGPCVTKTTSSAGLLTIRYSEFRNSPTRVAVSFSGGCSGNLLDMFSNTLTDFDFGVQATCAGTMLIRHNTFEAVGTGIALNGGANNVVQNNIFTNNTVTAATCGAATFTTRSHHHLFGNVSNGCLNGDPNTLTSNPSYAFASADDLRLAFGSPAVDSAFVIVGLDVCLGYPGDYVGAGSDRGGRESY